MTIKRVLFILLIFISFTSFGQKAQRIGYIDMNYILENIPEYQEAQAGIDTKLKTWQKKLDDLSKEIETQKTDLSNEKALLTDELIKEREIDIEIKEKELRRLQNAYFGPTGDLYQLRKQFAKPVQDQVYNAIQEIATRKQYDFVLDKSSDLILLYSNNKFDISELVLNSIVKDRKQKIIADRKTERLEKAGVINADTSQDESVDDNDTSVTEEKTEVLSTDENGEEKTEAQKKIDERNAKREALKAKIKAQQEARIRQRDSLKAVADEKRAAQLKEIEERKKKREEEIGNNN
jgi:Skp family chaperone for outer membrane proteins